MTKPDIKQKYLRDMKELPPELPEGEGKSVVKKTKVEVKQQNGDVISDISEEKPKMAPPELMEMDEVVEEKKRLPITFKDVVLAVVDAVSIVLIIIFLFRFPIKAQELKDHTIEQIKNESNFTLRLTDIETEKAKGDELNKLFLDESGVVDFVSEVEKLKSESGSIKRLTFTKQEPVKDKTGSYGIPVVIELVGSWETISQDLQMIDKLPFIFRIANFQADTSLDDENVVTLEYGVFLYVNDKLGKN